MPLQWRLHVLGARIAERFDRTVKFEEVDLYALQGGLRNVALDALISGAELPFLLYREAVVSAGDFDPDAICDALA